MLAPTGTIGFMMDCDTTGIEPDIALIKYKRLVGGGMIKIVNNTVARGAGASSATTTARRRRSSTTSTREETIEGAPGPQGRAPAGVRLRLPRRQRHPLDPLHGPHPHDGGGPAVPLGRDLQDGQPAARRARSRTSRTRTSRPGSSASRRSPSTATAASAPSRCRPARPTPAWARASRSATVAPSGAGPVASGPPAAVRAQAARRARVAHPQVLDRRPRGLHPRRPLRDGKPGEIFVAWPRRARPSRA